MKKKLLGLVLAICFILPCGFILSACGGSGKSEQTITFEENGGSYVADIVGEEGSTVIAPTDPTRDGYSFDGWYTDINLIGERYTFDKIPNETLTLWAKWNLETYDITYTLNGESLSTQNPSTYTIETQSFQLINPTKIGYTFEGWTGSNGATPEHTVTIMDTFGDKEYTANWTESTYTVSFESNNTNYGTVNTETLTGVVFGSQMSVYENKITIGGTQITATPTLSNEQYTYAFDKWQVKIGNNDFANITGQTISDDVVIRAIFKQTENRFSVTVSNSTPAMGSLNITSVSDIAYSTEYVIADNTITIGVNIITATPSAQTTSQTYSFARWEIQDGSGAWNTAYGGNGFITKDLNIRAIFTSAAREYSVTFASNNLDYGQINSVAQSFNVDIAYGSSISVADNVMTIGGVGYTATAADQTTSQTFSFTKWQINGSDVVGGETISGATTITAIFSPAARNYSVTWMSQDGQTQLEFDESVPYGTTPDYNGEVPTKEPTVDKTFIFKGWSQNPNEALGEDENSLSVGGNTTYYAAFNFVAREYTVSFVVEGSDDNGPIGTISKSSISAEYNSTIYGNADSTQITIDGDTVNFNPRESTAEYKYYVLSVKIGDVDIVTGTTTVTGDITIKVRFVKAKQKYTVTWKTYNNNNPIEAYDITLETDLEVEYGFTPSFEGTFPAFEPVAYPNNTYEFAGWSTTRGTLGAATPSSLYEYKVSGDVTFYACFTATPKVYTITVKTSNAEKGTLSKDSETEQSQFVIQNVPYNTGAQAFPSYGNTLTFGGTSITANCAEGYQFEGWHITNASGAMVTNETDIASDMTIVAVFIASN